MRTLLVYGFWIWLLISVAVLVWRRFDKKYDPSDASSSAVPEMSGSPSPAPSSAATPLAATPLAATAPAATPPAAAPIADQLSSSPATTEKSPEPRTMETIAAMTTPTPDLDETQLLPAVAAARRAELGLPPLPVADAAPAAEGTPTVPDGPTDTVDPEMLQPSVASALREQTIAGTVVAATPAAPGLFDNPTATAVSVPLTESLAGIAMPVGLAPLTKVGDFDGPDNLRERLTMWTSEAEAGAVAAAVSQELHRLGHAVSPLDSTSAVARRDGAAVEIRIYADPESVLASVGQMFPSAPPNSVVVDFLAS